jgi:hypothetical protein
MAVIGAVVALFYALFLFQGYTAFFRDSDTGWHIRTGEMILSAASLPHSDPYSFSRAGEPWLAWEWLSDVLMGAVHQVSGLAGIAMLYGLAIAAGVWLWFRLNWDAGGNFLLACALAPPLAGPASCHQLDLLAGSRSILGRTRGSAHQNPGCRSRSGGRTLDQYPWKFLFRAADSPDLGPGDLAEQRSLDRW